MKAIPFCFTLLLLTSKISLSQPVIEYVAFDIYQSPVDNDFVNNFTGGLGLAQITTSGITGGCLTTPNTISWGNDNAIYCSKYIDSASYSNNTRIAFRYDTTQINTANFDRAVSIFLRPNADFNHYVIGSITHDKKIQILSYSASNNPVVTNLQHNHWYDFILSTSFTTPGPVYQITASAQLNDLGLTGLTPPIPAGNSSVTFNDSLLFVDTAVQVSFTGTLWGGAKFIDNFRFQGMKSADSCNNSTGLLSVEPEAIRIFINGNILHIVHELNTLGFEVYAVSGQRLFSGNAPPGNSSYPVSHLKKGVYFVRLLGMGNEINKINITGKFIIAE